MDNIQNRILEMTPIDQWHAAWCMRYPQYEERPVDIVTFINSPLYMNAKEECWEPIKEDLKELFEGYDDPYMEWRYNESVLDEGIDQPRLNIGMTQEDQFPDYDGKYDIAIYPSSYGLNIQGILDANNNNHLYVLDPEVDLTTGLEIYYSFDVNASDDSGNGNHGIVTNAVNQAGFLNNGYDFDGDGDWIVYPELTASFWNNDFSVSLWFRPDDSANYQYLFSMSEDVDALITWSPTSHDNEVRFHMHDGTLRDIYSSTLTAGNWYHIVALQDSSGMKLYINNGTPSTNTFTGDATDKSDDNVMGNGAGLGETRNFDGMIDEVAIYSFALNESQISSLYNNGNGYNPLLADSPSDPFVVTAKNTYNESMLNIFNATIDGSFYSTTNGTLNTGLIQNSSILHNLTINAEDHFSISIVGLNVSTNYETQMFQSDSTLACYEKITSSLLSCVESDLVNYNGGVYNITANVTGYNSITQEITISEL